MFGLEQTFFIPHTLSNLAHLKELLIPHKCVVRPPIWCSHTPKLLSIIPISLQLLLISFDLPLKLHIMR
jgi:hypothetical protein